MQQQQEKEEEGLVTVAVAVTVTAKTTEIGGLVSEYGLQQGRQLRIAHLDQ